MTDLPDELEERRLAALSLAERATEILDGLQRQLNHLSRRTWLNLFLVILDIALSIGFGYALVQANHATHAARSEVTARCQAENQFRTSDKQLWQFVVAEVKRSPQAAQDTQQIADLQRQIITTFAPTNCGNLSSP